MIVNKEVIQKQDEYLDYINQHIKNVYKAFTEYDKIISRILKYDSFDLCTRVVNHDKSKFNDVEFFPYRRKYYPTLAEKLDSDNPEAEKAYNCAWIHHCMNNDHHPEYWVDRNNNPTTMPDIAIAEMILDWIAMGWTNNNTAYSYYSLEGKNKPLNDYTRAKVVRVLNALMLYDSKNNNSVTNI